MDIEHLTCPLTGCDLYMVRNGDEAKIEDPIAEIVRSYRIIDGDLCIPLEYLEHIAMLSPASAAQALRVSQQRITQLMKAGKLPCHYINGQPFIREDDVLEYAQMRKNGRPAKE